MPEVRVHVGAGGRRSPVRGVRETESIKSSRNACLHGSRSRVPTSVRHASSRREVRKRASTSTSTWPMANGRPCGSGYDQTVKPPARRGPRWKAITLLPDNGRGEVEGSGGRESKEHVVMVESRSSQQYSAVQYRSQIFPLLEPWMLGVLGGKTVSSHGKGARGYAKPKPVILGHAWPCGV